ncbi:uncharacterized protein LOC116304228, partial [Actinia tenebrosa]|uniref:Uncharacterized protein LOC116304228 n=1 Tax=Actinia tenebrosa TaxID=6105 RepID=A0A6P8ISC2_ACTTE
MESSDPISPMRRSLSDARLDGAESELVPDFLSERETTAVVNFKRTRTLTAKGQQYETLLKETNLDKALKELKNIMNNIELTWLDHGSDILRKNRHNLEKYRNNLQILQEDLRRIASIESHHELINSCNEQNKEALELRKRLGERIFELEREETRS